MSTHKEQNQAGLFHSLRIADSFFPTGTITLSHGLETFIDEGRVQTADDFQLLLQEYIHAQIGPLDSVAFANAHRAATTNDLNKIIQADHALTAMKPNKEMRETSMQVGKQLLSTCMATETDSNTVTILQHLHEAVHAKQSPGNYCIVMAVHTASHQIPCKEAMMMELYTFAVSFLGAATRMGKLNYLEVQQILQKSEDIMNTTINENADKNISDMAAFTPLIDIMSMHHTHASKRLFVS